MYIGVPFHMDQHDRFFPPVFWLFLPKEILLLEVKRPYNPVRLSVCWSDGQLVGWPICHSFLEGLEG